MDTRKLEPGMGPIGAWALALGTSIGWGSLVVTSKTYLSQAGPWGSVAGLLAGAAIMLLISRNYHYMMNCFPDAGGAYAFSKETFGYDHGFLTAWFLCLTYLAMLWANATSLPLFTRYFFGDVFRFGRLYSLFGYEVYLGEALLSMAALLLTGLLCSRRRKATMAVLIGLVLLFTAGIVICFASALLGRPRFAPAFVPDKSALSQIVRIAVISPWAFIGFETISHATEEFSFRRSKVFSVLVVSVLSATVLYCFVLLLSASAYPPEYSSWLAYIRDLDKLDGIKGLPAFYAASRYLGGAGVGILVLALLALIVTSLIGNTLALSRLFYAMARDEVLPRRFAQLNRQSVPGEAVWLVICVSLLIPFLGRTAIGWIVDVTTIGATLIYGFVSAATRKIAGQRQDKTEIWTGRLGLVLMVAFGAYILIPNFFSAGTMEKESYFLFVVWSVLGFVLFRNILHRDRENRFGRSFIVWIALLMLVLLIALIWMNQTMMLSTDRTKAVIHEYYAANALDAIRAGDESFVEAQLDKLERTNLRTMLVVAGLFVFAVAVMFTNYSYMNRKALESEIALGRAQDRMDTDPLTGVKSKHAYDAREQEMDGRIQSGQMEPFALAVCDVNGLKYVNDTYGHKAGDETIVAAARFICELFDHSPVFRIGGDEFVVVLTGRDYENREAILRKLHRRAEENIDRGQVVVAAGMAEYVPGQDARLHPVFERADGQMYRKKQELKALGAHTR